eukprot:TRINITY_DN6252_c0_g1_i4.p1 TRINITY_DN6252_c0_g1~~TRINITY_DN6252_c0_g1_i4.p1  ORF type:complete len:306 (+),score=54.99 TRINITY_DN6252_c0_g1_i4:313-1230(+)
MILTSSSQPDSNLLHVSDKKQIGINPTSRGHSVLEGPVLRCLWDTHWAEEWCRLYHGRLSLYRTFSRKPRLKLDLQHIISVRAVDAEPIPGFFCFVMETASVVHCLCVATKEERDQWIQHISVQVYQASGSSEFMADAAGILSAAHRWSGNRVILNGRRNLMTRKSNFSDDASEAVQLLLRQALGISSFRQPEWPELCAFLDNTAWLKLVNLDPLTLGTHQSLSFFLNLYHLILIHSFLISELPSSERAWSSLHNRFCYEVGGYVFSLAEIEHCVLRASMSKRRSGWLSGRAWTIPKWSPDDPRS